MAILIDGYNLLHVTGIFSDAVGPGSVEKLHSALLDFLAAAIDPADLPHTTIVFDAKGRRAGSRRSHRHGDITVHYAARHEDADTWLAELIREHSSPRRLIVVSSDHQVQRAARRRRAKAVDSDVWYADLIRRRRDRRQSADQPTDAKPSVPLSESDAAWWLAQFAPELLQELANETASSNSSTPRDPSQVLSPQNSSTSPSLAAPADVADSPRSAEDAPPEVGTDYESLGEPFPPSYLEAIEREFLSGAPVPPPPKPGTGKPAKQRRKRR